MNNNSEGRTRPSILVVDDEAAITRVLALLLSTVGAVRTAASATEALEFLRLQPVDLVICDMDMPGLSGAELLSQVAQDWPRTERLLMSGCGPSSAIEEALRQGDIGCFFSKPLDMDQFRREVETRARKAYIMRNRCWG